MTKYQLHRDEDTNQHERWEDHYPLFCDNTEEHLAHIWEGEYRCNGF